MKELAFYTTPIDASVELHHDTGPIFKGVMTTVDGRVAHLFTIDGVPDGNGCELVITREGFVPVTHRGILWLTRPGRFAEFVLDDVHLVKGSTNPFKRRGLVRSEGRSFIDDSGPFHPLGGTLFWAPRGWHNGEQERVRLQWAYFKAHGYDFTRVLFDVGWGNGLGIDSAWSGYQTTFANMLDTAYDEFGLRTMVTLWGGRKDVDPMHACNRLLEVIPGREHKIIFLEGANERNLGDTPKLVAITRKLQATGILTAPGFGDDYGGVMQELLTTCGTLASVHLSRQAGDYDWRFVRQAWDVKGYPWPTQQGEPKGPLSSVSSNTNPLQLAMARGVGVMCGSGAYVLHNGAGIYGVPLQGSTGFRPANVWETPGIEVVMDAVRSIDPLLPIGVENWTKANTQWQSPNPVAPLQPHAYWEGNSGEGVNKAYAALGPDGRVIQMPCGVKERVILKASYPLRELTVYDPLTGAAVPGFKNLQMTTGQTIGLPGRANTLTAYVVHAQR